MSTSTTSTLYDPDMLEIATTRGYNHEAHLAALKSENEDQVTLTHPANWYAEWEVECCTTFDKMLAEGLIERRQDEV